MKDSLPQGKHQDLRKQTTDSKAIWQITLHYLLDLAGEGTEKRAATFAISALHLLL